MKIAHISIADWAESCQGLALEEEALFLRLTLKMHSREGGLPDSDRDNARILGGLDPRVFRRLKDRLIKLGLIEVRDGLLVNDRALEEVEKFRISRGKVGPKSPELRPDFPRTSGKSPTASHVQLDVKSKGYSAVLPLPLPLHSGESGDSEGVSTVLPSSTGAREPADGRTALGRELKSRFNGSTDAMLDLAQASLGNDRDAAERWLASTVSAHGAEAVAQGFAALVEKQARGEVVAKVLACWSRIAQSAKSGAAQPSGRPAAQSAPPMTAGDARAEKGAQQLAEWRAKQVKRSADAEARKFEAASLSTT